MTARSTILRAPFGILAAFWVVSTGPVWAESSISAGEAEAVTEGQPGRYSLVKSDGDVLRIDRQNGTVSVCREKSGAWRCAPVPLAEDAYQAEISELAAEVDRLTARLETLDPDDGAAEPGDAGKALGDAETTEGQGSGERREHGNGKSVEDEELEQVLSFTESAMRRFFGMVRDLQKDFEDNN